MSLWFDIARVSHGLNLLLLVGLGYVWVRNYLEFRSKHTLGLLLFSVFLLLENGFALYIYMVDPDLSVWFSSAAVPDIAWQGMMVLPVLEAVGLAFLLWVTWD
ncbi:hypothetical protein SAMN04487949_1295 [Halogranum gelatinilyticum]|uniref:Uncharacterized protein n=1 Tax=Halogranum gelatinilyticum TaxID=660521 RepID=A0A1G9RDK6_9EURY|nr:hypothetical protein [Halogranum gelatinilyticum]SDM21303.1 hypothetical protein SAMN04487949_1295 [Halogranum gelatinilyticum]